LILKLRSGKGQALVEFAYVLPLMVTIILGITEFGVIFYDKAVITNASREGARTGIAYRTSGPGSYSPVTQTEVETAVNNYLQSRLITFSGTAAVTTQVVRAGTSPQLDANGGTVAVQVSYQHTYLALPKIAGWGNTINISARTVMRLQ
jgi:Flp pilus assembly protein TadG